MNTLNDVAENKSVAELPPRERQSLEQWGQKVGIQVEAFQELSVGDLIKTLMQVSKAKKESHNGPRRKVKFA